MESKVLGTAGKIAGLGGLALGTLLIIFKAILGVQFVPIAGLNQSQAFAIMLAVLVFTFGIAGIGLIAWIIGRRDPKNAVPNSALGMICLLFLCVLGAAIYVSREAKSVDPIVVPENKPTAAIVPPPPSVPARPVDGVWDLQMNCSDGSSLNELGSQFRWGRYARGFSGSAPGMTQLALGYISNNELKLTGYVSFDGVGVYNVGATGKQSGATLSGTGHFGSSTQCTLTGSAK